MISWRLFTIAGPNSGQTFSLPGRTLFGRGDESHVCIPDDQVSRLHAQIELTPDGYLLTDLGSTNGTYLNDKRLEQPALLHDGDSIAIGPARFLVLAAAPGA